MNKFTKLSLAVIAILVIFASVFLQSCQKGEEEEKAIEKNKSVEVPQQTIKIAAILPLTGNLSFLGEPERNALLMAFDDVRQEGKNIKLLIEDSKGQAKDGISAINKLLAQNVKFFIVSTTGINRAVKPIVERESVIMFAECMDPVITSESKYIFRIFPNYMQEQRSLVNYLDHLGIKKVGLFYANSAGIKPEADAFKKLATEASIGLAYEGTFELDQTNFRDELFKIKNVPMDGLVILAYGNSYPPVMKQIRDLRFNIPIFGNVAMEQEKAVEGGTEIYEGVVFPSLTAVRSNDNKVGELKERYFQRYKKYPGGFLDYAYFYDAFRIIAEVAEKSQGDPEVAIDLFLSHKFHGVAGPIKFSPQGDAHLSVGLMKYVNGRVVPVDFEKN